MPETTTETTEATTTTTEDAPSEHEAKVNETQARGRLAALLVEILDRLKALEPSEARASRRSKS
jgi:hypothetical protein